MRQALEMARNPGAMREMMRSQDRQLSNIEVWLWACFWEMIDLGCTYYQTGKLSNLWVSLVTTSLSLSLSLSLSPSLSLSLPLIYTESTWRIQRTGQNVLRNTGAHDGCSSGISPLTDTHCSHYYLSIVHSTSCNNRYRAIRLPLFFLGPNSNRVSHAHCPSPLPHVSLPLYRCPPTRSFCPPRYH